MEYSLCADSLEVYNPFFCRPDSNSPDLFRVDKNSGIISVNSMIDRESLLDIEAKVKLQVMVSLLPMCPSHTTESSPSRPLRILSERLWLPIF